MDDAVIKYYRALAKNGFRYAGSFDNPSILIKDESGERKRLCTSVGSYVRIYINISDKRITGIKYLCTCNPLTHVAIEILCSLCGGMELEKAKLLRVESFSKLLGTESKELESKAESLIELLNEGIDRYYKSL